MVFYYTYQSNSWEPVVNDGLTTIFSKKRCRLTDTKDIYIPYDDGGRAYTDGEGAHDFYKTIKKMQKDGKPNLDHIYDLTYEGLDDLLSKATDKGFKVIGHEEVIHEQWNVINDSALVKALDIDQNNDSAQIITIKGEDGHIYKTDLNYNALMEHKELDDERKDGEFFDIYQDDLLLTNVPTEQLGTVLFCLTNGLPAEQIEEQFLFPQLSADMEANANITFNENFISERVVIESIKDLNSLREKNIIEDKHESIFPDLNHKDLGNFRFSGLDPDKWWGAPIGKYRLGDVFDYFNHDCKDNNSIDTRYLSDMLISMANDNLNLEIFRQQRQLLGKFMMEEFTFSDELIPSTYDRYGATFTPLIEANFSLWDKDSMKPVYETSERKSEFGRYDSIYMGAVFKNKK